MAGPTQTPDGSLLDASERRQALIYPLETAPSEGCAVEVCPGVMWMRMPIGGALGFINVWALRDADGWALVDTGFKTDATAQAWRAVIAGALGGLPITRLFATHLHPDHVGLAGWITREYGCRLWMTRLEYVQCRMLVEDTGRPAPPDAIAFYRGAGWDEAALDAYKSKFGAFGRLIDRFPDSYRRLSDGERLQIGDHEWRVIVGSGHSPEHACLYCPSLNLFISGDQVLPRISSNVSVFPTEPDADPLSDWLTSLARIKTQAPGDVLVLPSHNDPFIGLHARLDHLISGHERGLQRLSALLVQPRRAVDVFRALFYRQIGPDLLGMATGEAIAHLNCLIGRGQATASRDEAGVNWYSGDGQ